MLKATTANPDTHQASTDLLSSSLTRPPPSPATEEPSVPAKTVGEGETASAVAVAATAAAVGHPTTVRHHHRVRRHLTSHRCKKHCPHRYHFTVGTPEGRLLPILMELGRRRARHPIGRSSAEKVVVTSSSNCSWPRPRRSPTDKRTQSNTYGRASRVIGSVGGGFTTPPSRLHPPPGDRRPRENCHDLLLPMPPSPAPDVHRTARKQP